jgi:hypothetical protein
MAALTTGWRNTDSFSAHGITRVMVDDMNALLSTFLTFFALDEIERTGLRAMAVIVLIESRIALKPERLPLVGDLHY